MGDVADILGLDGGLKKVPGAGGGGSKKQRKPEGMSRELFALVGTSLPSVMPAAGSMEEMTQMKGKKAQEWVWTQFTNSARTDEATFTHWQRKEHVNNDYAFSRFNRKTAVIKYQDEEYSVIIAPNDAVTGWSKSETDTLFQFCEDFDLRWYVIGDRWNLNPERTVTELKSRYYDVTKAIVLSRRNKKIKPLGRQGSVTPPAGGAVTPPTTTVLAGGAPNGTATIMVDGVKLPAPTAKVTAKSIALAENEIANYTFDRGQDEKRVHQLEVLYSRTPAEEKEEANIVNEIRRTDHQLRRLQKSAPLKRKTSQATLQAFPPTLVDSILSGGAPNSQSLLRKEPGVYMRSEEFDFAPSQNVLGPKIVTKMKSMFAEMGIPAFPIATANVASTYDKLRQDTLKLLALQSKLLERKNTLSLLQGRAPIISRGGSHGSKGRTKRKNSAPVSAAGAGGLVVKIKAEARKRPKNE